jgi:Carboxypeptidase regulatory-like domain
MRVSVFAAVAAGALAAMVFAAPGEATSTGGAWLSGTVNNVQLGTHVAGVKVRAFLVGSEGLQDSAITDSNGEFTLVHLRPGTYRLAFDASGYHESLIADVRVKDSDDHIHLTNPVALYPANMDIPLQAALMDPCHDLVQPGQTASVYIVCTGR